MPYYWIFLLGILSGMRTNEMCQLRLSDLRKEKGIWFIHVEDDEDKRLIFTLEEEEVLVLSAMSVSELFDESKLGFWTFEAGPDFTLEAGPGLDDDLGPGLDDFGPGLLLFGPILGFSGVFLSSSSSSSSELELFLLFFLSSLILALLFLTRFFSVS